MLRFRVLRFGFNLGTLNLQKPEAPTERSFQSPSVRNFTTRVEVRLLGLLGFRVEGL